MQRLTSIEPLSPPEEMLQAPIMTPRSRSTFAGRLGAIINPQSLVVQRIEFGSPAERAGLQPGDRLVAVNGDYLEGFDQLQALLRQRPSSAIFVIDRNQEFSNVQINWVLP
jgi:membrane-associated protease RseP (regulator of RpoE activity)